MKKLNIALDVLEFFKDDLKKGDPKNKVVYLNSYKVYREILNKVKENDAKARKT